MNNKDNLDIIKVLEERKIDFLLERTEKEYIFHIFGLNEDELNTQSLPFCYGITYVFNFYEKWEKVFVKLGIKRRNFGRSLEDFLRFMVENPRYEWINGYIFGYVLAMIVNEVLEVLKNVR